MDAKTYLKHNLQMSKCMKCTHGGDEEDPCKNDEISFFEDCSENNNWEHFKPRKDGELCKLCKVNPKESIWNCLDCMFYPKYSEEQVKQFNMNLKDRFEEK
jgi:hypothetical protein